MTFRPRASAAVPLALLAFLGVGAAPGAAEGSGEALSVAIDHARVLKIDAPAETVIIGNPSIVDVAIHDANTLILTGRSYGVTNLVVLDRGGEAVVDESVIVNSVETASVRVYRQAARTSYSCSPSCEPTVTVGDVGESFSNAATQFGQRETLARGTGQ